MIEKDNTKVKENCDIYNLYFPDSSRIIIKIMTRLNQV